MGFLAEASGRRRIVGVSEVEPALAVGEPVVAIERYQARRNARARPLDRVNGAVQRGRLGQFGHGDGQVAEGFLVAGFFGEAGLTRGNQDRNNENMFETPSEQCVAEVHGLFIRPTVESLCRTGR